MYADRARTVAHLRVSTYRQVERQLQRSKLAVN